MPITPGSQSVSSEHIFIASDSNLYAPWQIETDKCVFIKATQLFSSCYICGNAPTFTFKHSCEFYCRFYIFLIMWFLSDLDYSGFFSPPTTFIRDDGSLLPVQDSVFVVSPITLVVFFPRYRPAIWLQWNSFFHAYETLGLSNLFPAETYQSLHQSLQVVKLFFPVYFSATLIRSKVHANIVDFQTSAPALHSSPLSQSWCSESHVSMSRGTYQQIFDCFQNKTTSDSVDTALQKAMNPLQSHSLDL